MTLEELKARQTQLVLQRAAAKDQVELAERSLQQLGFGIQLLEAQQKATPEPTED